MINPMATAVASVVFLSALFAPAESTAQDSLSTVYFYRPKKSTSSMRYDLQEGKIPVGTSKPGTVAVYQGKPGTHDFVAAGKTLSTFQLFTEAGKEYYIECFVKSNQPAFRMATRGEARREIAKIDKAVSQKIAPVIITTSADTVKALQHLFKRKRTWGIFFTAIGAIGTPVFIAKLINYEPEVLTSKNNTGGLVATTTIDETPQYITAILNGGVLIITGATLWGHHTPRKLAAILENKAEGKPFPFRVLKQLKPKDFVAR